jgi:hypothetical protein
MRQFCTQFTLFQTRHQPGQRADHGRHQQDRQRRFIALSNRRMLIRRSHA